MHFYKCWFISRFNYTSASSSKHKNKKHWNITKQSHEQATPVKMRPKKCTLQADTIDYWECEPSESQGDNHKKNIECYATLYIWQ